MQAHRVLSFLLFGAIVWAQQYVITTIAGGAPPSTPAAAATSSVGDPTRLAVDAAGNVGSYAALAIGADGLPVVSYHDNSIFRQKVVKCANAFCSPFFRRR